MNEGGGGGLRKNSKPPSIHDANFICVSHEELVFVSRCLVGKSESDEKFAKQFKSFTLRPHQTPDYIERKRRKSQPILSMSSSGESKCGATVDMIYIPMFWLGSCFLHGVTS